MCTIGCLHSCQTWISSLWINVSILRRRGHRFTLFQCLLASLLARDNFHQYVLSTYMLYDARYNWSCPILQRALQDGLRVSCELGLCHHVWFKRDLPELLPRAFWKWKDSWVYLDILWDKASTVNAFGILFLPRAGEASCPTVHTGLKPLGRPHGWYSQVSNLNVWKALGASFNWFILGAQAPCITLASLEKEYFGSLPWGCNPCGKGRHDLQKACYQWTWWGPGKQNC